MKPLFTSIVVGWKPSIESAMGPSVFIRSGFKTRVPYRILAYLLRGSSKLRGSAKKEHPINP